MISKPSTQHAKIRSAFMKRSARWARQVKNGGKWKRKKKDTSKAHPGKKGQVWKEETFLNVCATATYWLDFVSFSMCACEDIPVNVCYIYTKNLWKVCKGWELIGKQSSTMFLNINLALVTCTDEGKERLNWHLLFFCRSWPFWTHFKNSGDCFTSLFVLQKVHEMSFFLSCGLQLFLSL